MKSEAGPSEKRARHSTDKGEFHLFSDLKWI